jgi:hypothetical protein
MNLHTSYTDVLDLAFQDRVYLIDLINKQQESDLKKLEEIQTQGKEKRR